MPKKFEKKTPPSNSLPSTLKVSEHQQLIATFYPHKKKKPLQLNDKALGVFVPCRL